MTSSALSPPLSGTVQHHDGIAWLVLDEPGKKVNTLSSRTLVWLENALAEIEAEGPRGLVVLSAKRASFVAGADIEELAGFSDPEGVTRLLQRGHALLGRLADLPFPTVAAIHGACLGGGLELALACTWRVATEAEETRLGLPEVQLGLIPGLGGTQRLPRLIGVPAALDLIATGKAIDARRARRLGLVDETCHRHDLERAAVAVLARRRVRRRPVGLAARTATFLAKVPVAGALVFGKARREIKAKTGGHYPAPLAAVDVMASGLPKPLARGLEIESEAFARLVVTPAAKHLMAIFFMKNDVEARAAKLAEAAPPVTRVGVLGAGFMGAGIAQALAAKGVTVALKDRDLASLSRGMKQAAGLFAELVQRRRLNPVEARTALGRIRGTTEIAAFRGIPLVIEAVFEDLGVKHKVLAEVEAVAPERMVFASNTSTLPIADVARGSRRREQVVGMHFFSPAHKMPLLEVIRPAATREDAVAMAVAVGRKLGKTVIVVGDGPGFFTTRVLAPFLNEAAWCLTEGASIERIDGALGRWGWPAGGLALMDEVGLDIGLHVGEVMRAAFGDRIEAPPVLDKLVADGRLGRKSGRGFYLYGQGKEKGNGKRVDRSVYSLLGWQPAEIAPEEIADRCFLAMLNETARTMEEGVITNPIDVDIGVLFGFGFPAFRGGILREAERQGIPRIVDRLERYADRLGSRFRPAALLASMAASGSTFYKAG